MVLGSIVLFRFYPQSSCENKLLVLLLNGIALTLNLPFQVDENNILGQLQFNKLK